MSEKSIADMTDAEFDAAYGGRELLPIEQVAYEVEGAERFARHHRLPKPKLVHAEKSRLVERFIDVTLVENGMRYRVGSGNGSAGNCGLQVAVFALRRAGGHEIVLQMDSGKLESYAPEQLFPIIESKKGIAA